MDVNTLIANAESMPAAKPIGTTPDIEAYADEGHEEVRGLAWRISDDKSADWALMRLAECEAEAEAIDLQYEEALTRLQTRRDDLKAKAARGASYFHFQITRYAEENRGSLLAGKKKSREYMHGRIQFRSSPERLRVTDKDALAEWLATQPVEHGFYRVKLEPEMRALNAAMKEQGVVPPGCDVEPSRESINVDAMAPEAALMRKG